VVATLDCEFDCWFVTDTVSVPLVLFAMVVVLSEQVYWSLPHALLQAAKAGTENANASIIMIKIASFIILPRMCRMWISN